MEFQIMKNHYKSLKQIIQISLSDPVIGLPEDLAAALAETLSHIASKRYGGNYYYIKSCPKNKERNQAIRQEYGKHKVSEIAEKYGVGRRQIFRIVNGL
jgi:Mor family transcriptional regulator